jgi:lysophospholipase L1-like esterase
VIIGGVSNRDDADSVRSVVKQLKAEKPDIDIMLVTPVFGSKDNVYNRDWTYEIDPSKYLFRAQLRDIAKEEKCAFFDMTAEWKKYVNESGFDVGWFMRDPVHANVRGSQILGRLLEIWFDDKK